VTIFNTDGSTDNLIRSRVIDGQAYQLKRIKHFSIKDGDRLIKRG